MDLQLLSKIDYGLYSDSERAELVDELLTDEILRLIENNFENTSVQAQLEGLANYILYGKNTKTNTNAVQEKAVYITTKYSTYAKKNDTSLDELLANPAFDEKTIKDLYTRNTYTRPKNPIRRPTYDSLGNELDPGDGNLPTMRNLWSSIDDMAHRIAMVMGKEEPDPGEKVPVWSSLKLYKMRHWLVDLRKHQYYIREAYEPVMSGSSSFSDRSYIDWGANSGYWRKVPNTPVQPTLPPQSTHTLWRENERTANGKIIPEESRVQWEEGQQRINPATGELEEYHLVRKHVLDFKNPFHVYNLLIEYDKLWKDSWDDMVGQMKTILMAFDEVGRKTHFTPIQEEVLDLKVAHWTNERIQQRLQEKFGVSYNVNYISTMFKKTICEKIAATASRLEKEHMAENEPGSWKKCTTCDRLLLRDKSNFVRKASSSDGLASRCKMCDKNIRDGRPIGYGNN